MEKDFGFVKPEDGDGRITGDGGSAGSANIGDGGSVLRGRPID